MRRVALALLLSPLVMGACEGVSSDPRQGGFAGGVCGLSTGAYQRRLDARQRELDGLDAINRRLESRAASGQREAAGLTARIAQQKRQLAAAQAELAQLRVEVTALQQLGTTHRAELEAARREVAALADEFDRLSAAHTHAELAVRAMESGVRSAQAPNRTKGQGGDVDAKALTAQTLTAQEQSTKRLRARMDRVRRDLDL